MSEHRPVQRSNSVATGPPAANWPPDVDLDALYESERAGVDELVKQAGDMSVWSLESKRENALVYLHCKNNERLSYSVRAVTKITGTVANVTECLRSPDNATFRRFQKMLHAKNYLDSEVLHAHQRRNAQQEHESMTLKWMVLTSPKTLGRSKEFCFREYCTAVTNHPTLGTVGVCKFESYDGAAARYGIRAKPDMYSLTVFERSSFVVQQTPDDGMVLVTLTFAVRKARGGESVSPGVKMVAMRLASDLAALQKTVQHMLFQPSALAQKKEWVNDGARSNCSLCVQSFSMLRRRHHCRVCGEVVCSSCTVFKAVPNEQDPAKIRVCKACLAKSSTAENRMQVNNSSMCSTSSITSDEAHSPPNDANGHLAVSTSLSETPTAPSPLRQSPASLESSGLHKGSPLSLQDFELTNPISSPAPPQIHSPPEPVAPLLRKQSMIDSEASSSRSTTMSNGSTSTRKKSSASPSNRRIHYFNEDFEEICMLAMQTLECPMAGIRTEDFELVRYFDEKPSPGLPRSLPTFRRLASRGKPCIVLDVSSDKRISGEKRFTAKLQFFVGIPLMMHGEVIGDLCVADRYARETIDQQQVDVLNVLGETVTQYMQSLEYMEDLAEFKATHGHHYQPLPPSSSHSMEIIDEPEMIHAVANGVKEVAF